MEYLKGTHLFLCKHEKRKTDVYGDILISLYLPAMKIYRATYPPLVLRLFWGERYGQSTCSRTHITWMLIDSLGAWRECLNMDFPMKVEAFSGIFPEQTDPLIRVDLPFPGPQWCLSKNAGTIQHLWWHTHTHISHNWLYPIVIHKKKRYEQL